MKTSNRAVELYREGFQARKIRPAENLPYQCSKTFLPLKKCLGNKTSVLNIDESGCDTTEWKSNCTGQWRRYFIEQTYREQVNRQMYTQSALNTYAEHKTTFKGPGLI